MEHQIEKKKITDINDGYHNVIYILVQSRSIIKEAVKAVQYFSV